MSAPAGTAVRDPSAGTARPWYVRAQPDRPTAILLIAFLMIAGQLVFRGWALYPSWFYLDDYTLLGESRDQHLSGGYLLEPWNSHLMPVGRLIAWVVVQFGTLNWGLAASITLFVQALADVAALWMFVTLFGRRLAVLPLLGLYLTWSMTIPALMWWTAALTQLPIQLGFFVAVAAWVRYLRGRRAAWALAAYGGVMLGLLSDVKAALILPVLAFLALAYFARGSVVARVRSVVSRYRVAVVIGLPPALAYAAYYLSHVDQPFETPGPAVAGELADAMVGTAFLSSALGGPWRWSPLAPPNAFADPPTWTVHLCWVVVVLVVLYAGLRRERTGRAWALLGGYVAVLFVLLLTSRGNDYGGLIGLEYRYLTDASCVLALCLGLAFLPVRGAVGSSRRRRLPLLAVRVPTWVTAVLVALVCGSSLLSSAQAVHYWHDDNASRDFTRNLRTDLRSYGAVDLADTAVPEDIYPGIFAPANRVSRFTALLDAQATFPEASSNLVVVGPDGGLRRALIGPGVRSAPGRTKDCGWRVTDDGLTIPLAGRAFTWDWWVRIGYLASNGSPVQVTAGASRVDARVAAGLNSLYVHVEGSFLVVRIDGLDPGTTMCVDTIEVGQPTPGTAPE